MKFFYLLVGFLCLNTPSWVPMSLIYCLWSSIIVVFFILYETYFFSRLWTLWGGKGLNTFRISSFIQPIALMGRRCQRRARWHNYFALNLTAKVLALWKVNSNCPSFKGRYHCCMESKNYTIQILHIDFKGPLKP